MANAPWNDWYHVIAHAYGSWLRGDPRGFRTRHHREHVEGDYKNPPPKGHFDKLHAQSKSLMKREVVHIDGDLRQFVLDAAVEKLRGDSIEFLVASVDAKHLHVLGRFRDRRPREWIGRAKKHTSHSARQAGLREEKGGLWGKRCGVHPIRDRRHQLNVFGYILKHASQGAVVWRFDRDGK
ncbi:MAG: hypothetical protein ABSG31_07015 [Tepidisphaeraceae bacterium]